MSHDLLESIRRARNTIRRHRDQKGDDRCWLDDYFVWSLLPDSPQDPTTLPSFDAGMAECRKFFLYRRADEADIVPADAIQDKNAWDADLETMNEEQLQKTLAALQEAIRAHRDIHDRERTLADDRKLYTVLPEKIPADFRLPSEEEFLGEKQTDAGCPAFWKSHQTCPCSEHNLHQWGPCCKQ